MGLAAYALSVYVEGNEGGREDALGDVDGEDHLEEGGDDGSWERT